MADPATDPIRDEELVAYLDGELPASTRALVEERVAADPGLAARLDMLRRGSRDFRPAFDVLLDAAPTARLERLLAETIPARPSARWHWDRRLALIAAGIVLFLAGAAAGVFLPQIAGLAPTEQADNDQSDGNWRAVVAEYLTLYTRETLAAIPDDDALRATELKTVGTHLGLDLSPASVALPDLALKRAQLFAYEGKPLAQIAYLAPGDGPLAFCIIANGEPDTAPRFEERQGRNIVYWSKDGRAFMLIGAASRDQLEALAARLQADVT